MLFGKSGPGELGSFISEIPKMNLRGFNITMPYKKEIIPYLSQDPRLESVNTVAVRNGKLMGTSTDEAGFAKSLQEEGFSYKNKSIVFIGAGAVTGMLAADAAAKGAKQITLLNRTLEKAQILAEKNRRCGRSLQQSQALSVHWAMRSPGQHDSPRHGGMPFV